MVAVKESFDKLVAIFSCLFGHNHIVLQRLTKISPIQTSAPTMFARRVMSRLSSAARTAHAARAAHVARVSIAGQGSVSRYGAAVSQSVAAAWQPASSCAAAFSAPPSARSFAVFTSGFPDVPIPDVPLTEVPPGCTTCSSADCDDLTRPF